MYVYDAHLVKAETLGESEGNDCFFSVFEPFLNC